MLEMAATVIGTLLVVGVTAWMKQKFTSMADHPFKEELEKLRSTLQEGLVMSQHRLGESSRDKELRRTKLLEAATIFHEGLTALRTEQKDSGEKFKAALNHMVIALTLYGSRESIEWFLLIRSDPKPSHLLTGYAAELIYSIRKEFVMSGDNDIHPSDYLRCWINDYSTSSLIADLHLRMGWGPVEKTYHVSTGIDLPVMDN